MPARRGQERIMENVMAKKFKRENKCVVRRQPLKVSFMIQSIFFVGLIIFFAWALFSVLSIEEYPAEDSLVYEECTFIKYEFKETKYRKTSTMKYYYLYVEEYVEPLIIDNIVFNETNEEALQSLIGGDKIVVSLFEDDDKLYLYSVSHNQSDILSYEAYFAEHNSNDNLGVVVCSILLCMSLALFIAGVCYYKKNGKCLPIWSKV